MAENIADHFPVFMNLRDKNILIVGAGKVALRRIQTLRSFGAAILVIADEIRQVAKTELEQCIKLGEIRFRQKAFEASDLTEKLDIVIACTDNYQLNELIFRLCKERGILVNVASNHQLCDFYFPAVAKSTDMVVGITGNGKNHRKVAEVAEDIRRYLKKREEDIIND